MKQFPTGNGDSSASLAENLTSTSACSQEALLALRGQTNTLFMFVPANRHQLLDAVTDTLFCSEATTYKTLTILWDIRADTQVETSGCFVCSQSQKRVWQAEASSTERMPVSWAKCSAVKLLRSFHGIAAPTSAGAKLKTNWKHVSAHGGQMSVNKLLNCSSLWQQDHIVCYERSTFPFLFLLFVFFSNCDGDCLMLHLQGNRAHSCPEGFADGASKIPICWCSLGGFYFPLRLQTERRLVSLKNQHH